MMDAAYRGGREDVMAAEHTDGGIVRSFKKLVAFAFVLRWSCSVTTLSIHHWLCEDISRRGSLLLPKMRRPRLPLWLRPCLYPLLVLVNVSKEKLFEAWALPGRGFAVIATPPFCKPFFFPLRVLRFCSVSFTPAPSPLRTLLPSKDSVSNQGGAIVSAFPSQTPCHAAGPSTTT